MVRGWFPSRGHRNNTTAKKKKFGIRFFRLETLRIATNNFSTVVGRGGFGSVYKGVLPDDGRTVAIKRILKPYDGFLEKVELMSHLHHRNIIQVIGCCAEKGEQILVCEFAENGNVWDHLHTEKSSPALDWKTRAALCIGTARGLSYLHEDVNQGIIHLDIKPTNILLDANFVPKIADFDLMFIACRNRAVKGISGFECPDAEDTPITTHIRGTWGYMDPNYYLRGELTDKADVYSFGITILEIVTGRRVVDLATEEARDQRILDWVTRVRKEGTILQMVDPKLTDFPKEDVERFVNVALLCTRATPKLRPTMFQVVHMLYGRHKSDGEISEMALGAIADQPDQWSIAGSHHSGSMSSMAFSMSENAEARDIFSSSMRIDCAAEMQPGEESDESSIVPNRKGSIVPNQEKRVMKVQLFQPGEESDGSLSKGQGSSSKASSCKEDQSCPEDVVREYFERSMDKIMRFQAAKHRGSNRTAATNQTIVMNKSSYHTFMEAVYPPFLSGEYRTSRVLYSQRPTPL